MAVLARRRHDSDDGWADQLVLRSADEPEGIRARGSKANFDGFIYDTANATFAPSMAALMKLVPISQITYGTDYPYFGFGQVADLQKLGLSAGDLDAIGHENATRLIPRLK